MAFQYKLRRQSPQRTCKKVFDRYQSYKGYLKTDFNKRCGYCDITLLYKQFASIEHFAPRRKFPHLASIYGNLIYACKMCNQSKSSDWPMNNENPSHDGQQGYVDPCSLEYDSHLGRKSNGQIYGKTPVGEYMVIRLRLNLRDRIVEWQSDILRDKALEIKEILNTLPPSHPNYEALNQYYEQMKNLLNYRQSKWKIL
ncbi:MAG: HNH endonuclease [Candidatus Dadabacteria bacterium]|nr:HNH endonuclease [Candidatus Dadabacteria bacterium]